MQAFDAVVEASGSSQGIKLASALTRPMGTIVLKSTCSVVNDASMPAWSDIANDVVVNEKRLQGSRYQHNLLTQLSYPVVVKLKFLPSIAVGVPAYALDRAYMAAHC